MFKSSGPSACAYLKYQSGNHSSNGSTGISTPPGSRLHHSGEKDFESNAFS